MRPFLILILDLTIAASPALYAGEDLKESVVYQESVPCTLRFDPQKISRATVEGICKTAFSFSNRMAYLELCMDDARYKKCGSHDISDPHFIHNAEVNLTFARAEMAKLKAARFPLELKPVLDDRMQSLETSIALEARKLAYYKSWQPSELTTPLLNVDPRKACLSEIQKVEKAASKLEKYQKVAKDWSNCMNAKLRAGPEYDPHKDWVKFLTAYSIEETCDSP